MKATRLLFLFKKLLIVSVLIQSIHLLNFQSTVLYAFQQQENVEFEKFDAGNGLASSDVWAVIEDYKGLIWISSEGGLNQYNGYNIKLYEHDNLNPNSLGYNNVPFLFEDKEKNLWVCTRGGGLNLFNRDQDNFYIFKHIEGDSSSISGNNVNSIFQDSDGTYWVASKNNGVCTFKYNPSNDPTSIKFKRHAGIDKARDPSKDLTITTITEDQFKNKWICTDNQGIFILHPDNTITKLQHDPYNANSLASNNSTFILCDSKNRIWISTWDAGLDLYDPKSNTFLHYTATKDPLSLCNNQIWAIRESKNGELWIGTDTGLNRFEDASKAIPDNKFKRYTHNPDDDKSLQSNIIQSIYIDNQERLWVSTLLGGVNVWDKTKRKFYPIGQEKNNPGSLNGNNVRAFAEDAQGNIWIGTDGGGLNLNKKPGKLLENKFAKYVHDPQNPNSLTGDKILSLSIDSKGGIWIGTWATGLDYFNPNDNTFTHFLNKTNDSNSISSNEIFAVAVDKKDNLWIGTYRAGLNYYDTQSKTFTRYVHDPNDTNSIGSNMISSLLVDDNNNLWIGTDEGGLNHFEQKSETFKRYTNPDKFDFRQFVNCLYLDTKGTLWASFYGHGILYFDDAEDILRKYDGIDESILFVNGILDDGKKLWLSTNNGLFSFHQKTNETIYFDKKDGLQGNQFIAGSAFKTSEGLLLFGGNNGFNAFNPNNIRFNTTPPPIVFTDITINNKKVSIGPESPLQQHISETKHMTLKYEQNSFSISFAALDYTMPDENQYAYILEGFHDNWITLKNERKVVFTNLDADSYILRVKASNNDGVWNEQGISLNLEILPPWWQTLWFRLILAITIIICAITIYKLRMRYLKRQKSELIKIIDDRTKEINVINTELNDRLGVISTQNTLLNQQKNEIHKQNNQFAVVNKELAAQNEKIHKQNITLEEYQQQIEGINENLEQKINARTKKLNETISELNKSVSELDRFVYSASHDLSSPLKSILGLVHIANLENENERISEYLNYIESSIYKLEAVIKNLVQFSRNNRIEVKTDKIILHSLVTEVISELKFMPEAINIHFENNISHDHYEMSDGQRLKVIFHNLLSNAIKYADPEKADKKIIITNISDEKEWALTICDNGIGIEEENLNRIFNMFFRATEKSSGSGLGLFIVKETVERLKGKINVTSTPGSGSCFKLVFKH